MDIKAMGKDSRRIHKVSVNGEKCMGCKRCVKVCHYGVHEWDKENKQSNANHTEECTACMQCAYYCPSGAITIVQATVATFDPLFDPLGLND